MIQTDEGSSTVALMERGTIAVARAGESGVQPGHTDPVAVCRGMRVITCEGEMAGYVAAILLDRARQTTTHLLLLRARHPAGYRLIPVEWVAAVTAEQVHLRIAHTWVAELVIWHGP